jgi:hypothetical protein
MCDLSGIGRISSFHGGTGQKIADRDGIAPEWLLGMGLAGVGDLDGNGIADLLVQFQDLLLFKNLVSAVDGLSLAEIYPVPNPTSPIFKSFGGVMEAVGDIDGDHFPDYVLASPSGMEFDEINVYSGAPIGVATFGNGCAPAGAVIPRIGASGVPRIGTDFTSYLSRVEPGRGAFLIVGLSNTEWNGRSLPLDLGPLGLPGCSLWVAPLALAAAETQRVRAREGVAQVSFPIPAEAALVGESIYLQWAVDQGPDQSPRVAFTRGHQLTFQP